MQRARPLGIRAALEKIQRLRNIAQRQGCCETFELFLLCRIIQCALKNAHQPRNEGRCRGFRWVLIRSFGTRHSGATGSFPGTSRRLMVGEFLSRNRSAKVTGCKDHCDGKAHAHQGFPLRFSPRFFCGGCEFSGGHFCHRLWRRSDVIKGARAKRAIFFAGDAEPDVGRCSHRDGLCSEHGPRRSSRRVRCCE